MMVILPYVVRGCDGLIGTIFRLYRVLFTLLTVRVILLYVDGDVPLYKPSI